MVFQSAERGSFLVPLAVSILMAAPVQAAEDTAPRAEDEVIIFSDEKIPRETMLQMIKSGLSAPRSAHPDYADRIVCRIETVTGSRCKSLWCSTNGELERIRDANVRNFNFLNDAVRGGGMIDVARGADPDRVCINTTNLDRELAGVPPPRAPFVMLDGESLRRFADAYPRVRKIQASYDRRIEGTRGRREAVRLQQQADADMAQAIASADLDVATYNRIALRASRDDGLRSRVSALLNE